MSLRIKLILFLSLALTAVAAVQLGGYLFTTQNIWMGWSVAGGAWLLLILCFLLLLRTTDLPMRSAVHGLARVAGALEENSSLSHSNAQQLADGAGQQASSLEQTSASLEEINAMTRQNSQNASEARTMMEGAQELVERAGASMSQMGQAMDEISDASQEISNIIKTIDEIAFQTNLLALNAAVEAARAGEAGAGFAVVADEVRNLAMRAGEAAQSTQGLIENALNKVKAGVELERKTEEEFQEVANVSLKGASLVTQIADASSEQLTGLEQISLSLNQIESVTQRAAGQASDSSGLSQEMENGAQELRMVVADVAGILDGSNLKDQAEAMVDRAMKMLKRKGLDETLRIMGDKNGVLVNGDLYVFAGSTSRSTLLAHPMDPQKLVGPDLTDIRDIKGKAFFDEFITVARTTGSDWVSYWWPKPGDNAPSLKSTYIRAVPGQPVYLGCGVYF